MNSKTAKIGKYYRHKNTPNYGWAKLIEIIPPRKGINTTNYIVGKCEWSVHKNDTLGLYRYFRLSDLLEE